MKALRYIDNTGVMRVQVVPDDYELTRDEQRRLGKDFWFEGLYEALGAKDDHDKARKGQPAEPWLKELYGNAANTPEGFGLAARYPEAVGGPGAPDDREEPQTDWEALFRAADACAAAANEALCAERIAYAELKARAEKAEAENARLREALGWMLALNDDPCPYDKGTTITRARAALDAVARGRG
jgi:hypothetical protein